MALMETHSFFEFSEFSCVLKKLLDARTNDIISVAAVRGLSGIKWMKG